MALFVIWRRNPLRIPHGTFYRLFDDGFERCVMKYENGRHKIMRYEGIVVPEELLRPYLMRVQKRGVDEQALEHRRSDT